MKRKKGRKAKMKLEMVQPKKLVKLLMTINPSKEHNVLSFLKVNCLF